MGAEGCSGRHEPVRAGVNKLIEHQVAHHCFFPLITAFCGHPMISEVPSMLGGYLQRGGLMAFRWPVPGWLVGREVACSFVC